MQPASAAAKLGVFDSGVGGLSVLREIHARLPGVPTLYVADQGHLPYGPRSRDEIFSFVDSISRFLMDAGARVIVLACHSASAAGLHELRARYPDVTFVGIEPAVKPAVEATRSGVVGVLTTQVTANGDLYQSVLRRFAGGKTIITRVAPELVMLVEADQPSDGDGDAVRKCVQPLVAAGADQIVLACTHFPFIGAAIQAAAGDGVTLVDPGPAVARQVARVWRHSTPVVGEHSYFTSGDPLRLQAALRRLIGVDAPVTGLRWDAADTRLTVRAPSLP